MKPIYLHGRWFMGTSCMACGVLTCGTTVCAHWSIFGQCRKYATSTATEGGPRGGSGLATIRGANCDKCVAWCAVGLV